MTMNGRCQLVPPASLSLPGSRYWPRLSVQIGTVGPTPLTTISAVFFARLPGPLRSPPGVAFLRGRADGDDLARRAERGFHVVVEHLIGDVRAGNRLAVLLDLLRALAHPQELLLGDDDVERARAARLVLALDGKDERALRLAHGLGSGRWRRSGSCNLDRRRRRWRRSLDMALCTTTAVAVVTAAVEPRATAAPALVWRNEAIQLYQSFQPLMRSYQR